MKSEKFPARCKTKFHSWRKRYGVTIPSAAHLFGVTEKTVRNWDKREAPALVQRMIHIFERDLGGLHPDWRGITLRPNGKLYLGAMVGSHSGPVGLSAEHIRNYPAAINRLHQLESSFEHQASELVYRVTRLGHRVEASHVIAYLQENQAKLIQQGECKAADS